MNAKACSRSIVDLIVWSRLSGANWWNKVGISHGKNGRGLFATQSLQANDIVLSVPLRSTFSFLNFELEQAFPLKVSPRDYSTGLAWWPDLDWGTFALIAWLVCKSMLENPNTQPYIGALPRFNEASGAHQAGDAEQFAVLRSIARQSMRSAEYTEVTKPLVSQTASKRRHFDAEFEWMYTMVRSRSIPIWTQQGGHAAIRATPYGQNTEAEGGSGDICCIVPMVDMINHSRKPNVTIGFPGEEVSEFIEANSPSKRIDVEVSESFCLPSVSPKAYIVVRTKDEIQAGEELLMDYNQFYGFDPDIFAAWFDIPLDDQKKGDFTPKFGMSYRMK